MDLNIHSPVTFLKTDVIDTWESLIWTERYNDAGEVTLVVPTTIDNKNKYTEGLLLSTSGSRELALVDTVLDEAGAMTITGKFLTGFLTERLLRDTWSSAASSWKLTGTPGDIAATIVREMCTSSGRITSSILPGSYGAYEAIPNLTIAATPPGTSTTIDVDYGNVFDGVKAVCDADGLGFTMYPPNLESGVPNLIFLVYAGRDLTSGQSVYPVVAFDPALDTLTGVTEVRSIAGYKTAAYAWAANMTAQSQIGTAFVNNTTTSTGFARRTLAVDASDLDATQYTSAELTSILNRRAKNGLVNNNYVRTVDGQVVPQPGYVYGTDYLLGDIVELRGNTALASQARVIEYIRSHDNTGETAYPTLSVL